MQTVRRLALFAAVGLLLSGCAEGVVDGVRPRLGSLGFDFRPLFGTGSGGALVIPGTVIDSVRLDVTPEGAAAPLVSGRRLVRGDTVVAFQVAVPEGQTRFEARVLSPNGSLLLSGNTTVDIRQDGFTVALELQPRAPILVVTPDSVDVRRGDLDDSVIVVNRGLSTLAWTIDRVTPAAGSCQQLPCPVISPTSGSLEAGGSTGLLIRPGEAPPQLYVVRLTSPQGGVDLRVFVTQ